MRGRQKRATAVLSTSLACCVLCGQIKDVSRKHKYYVVKMNQPSESCLSLILCFAWLRYPIGEITPGGYQREREPNAPRDVGERERETGGTLVSVRGGGDRSRDTPDPPVFHPPWSASGRSPLLVTFGPIFSSLDHRLVLPCLACWVLGLVRSLPTRPFRYTRCYSDPPHPPCGLTIIAVIPSRELNCSATTEPLRPSTKLSRCAVFLPPVVFSHGWCRCHHIFSTKKTR